MEQLTYEATLELAETLRRELKDRIVRHNKSKRYYVILEVSCFWSSTHREFDGEIVIHYARDGKQHSRFHKEFFGIDRNTNEQYFSLVPSMEDIISGYGTLFVGKSDEEVK